MAGGDESLHAVSVLTSLGPDTVPLLFLVAGHVVVDDKVSLLPKGRLAARLLIRRVLGVNTLVGLFFLIIVVGSNLGRFEGVVALEITVHRRFSVSVALDEGAKNTKGLIVILAGIRRDDSFLFSLSLIFGNDVESIYGADRGLESESLLVHATTNGEVEVAGGTGSSLHLLIDTRPRKALTSLTAEDGAASQLSFIRHLTEV